MAGSDIHAAAKFGHGGNIGRMQMPWFSGNAILWFRDGGPALHRRMVLFTTMRKIDKQQDILDQEVCRRTKKAQGLWLGC